MKTHMLVDYLTMSFRVGADRMKCFTDWMFKKINFPVADSFRGSSRLPGYYDCFYYQGIKIHTRENELCLDLSGSGCRMVEELNPGWDWYGFLSFFHDYIVTPMKGSESQYMVHISRLDLAYDVLDSDQITVPFVQDYVLKNKFICKSDYHSCIIGNHEMVVYLGSPRSDRRLRIYDKAMEQNMPDKKWVRFEFQLRDDSATSFFLNLVQYAGNFSKCYCGALRDYLRFITKTNDGMNQSRKVTCRWWTDLLQKAEALPQLYLPGAEYGMSNISKYYSKGCASTVRTLLEANDGDVTEILETAANAKLNKRQREALAKWEKQQEENAKNEKDEPEFSIAELKKKVKARFGWNEVPLSQSPFPEDVEPEFFRAEQGTQLALENSKVILEILRKKSDSPF